MILSDPIEIKNTCLFQDFEIVQNLINLRIHALIEKDSPELLPEKINFSIPDDSPYGKIIQKNNLTALERVTLAIALAPAFYPGLLDNLVILSANKSHVVSYVGGITGNTKNYHGMIPTIETVLFVLAGNDPAKRIGLLKYFSNHSKLIQYNLIEFGTATPIDPFTGKAILPTQELVHYLTTSQLFRPEYSTSFPATLLESRQEWSDLVLDYKTQEEIEEINAWIKHGKTVLYNYGLAQKVKLGYRALFYGPPGTGKTLTAALLGKSNGIDVYRIDLSMVVSKYIGETEKNLANVFNRAEKQNWILFFDEADALFGKRTQTKDAHDRYANQEISYLLQRIEDYPGLIILATNLKSNIDDAFSRRFQSFVHFPMPDVNMRLELWQNTLPSDMVLEPNLDLKSIAEKYELSGGSITNVVRYVTLMAVNRQENILRKEDFLKGIIKEFNKDGKTI
ncbi:MAG TPA: ATP-binding protein [Cytophagaceae bacterium]